MANNNPRKIYTQFPEGKHKVLTLSYDDGKIPDRRLLEIFHEHGLKGTFNLNSGLENNPFKNAYDERIPVSEYKELYKGNEVACHTLTHPTIARCPREQIVLQVIEDRRNLERTMGYTVRGLAYPNGSFDDKVVDALRACGIRHARTVNSTESFAMPSDFLRWNPTCHHNNPRFEDLYNEFIDLHKTQYLYMMYVWGHSYEFTNNDNWDRIEEFCRMMGGQEDIWYATNIEIVDYMKAWKQMKFSADGTFAFNPTAYMLWIDVDREMVPVPAGQTLHF
jgi:peptidoglycan/xylan/chitin deacetylase (PgdA/CDA1 family)